MKEKEIFSKRLSSLRFQKGLTLQELGKAVGVSYQGLSLIEKGERSPSFDLLVKIASYFEVSSDYLIGTSDNANPPVEKHPDEEPLTMISNKDEDGNFVLIKIETQWSDGIVFSGKVEPKLYNYNTGDIQKDYEKAIKIACFIKRAARALWTGVDFVNNDIRNAIDRYEAMVSPDRGTDKSVDWFDRLILSTRDQGGRDEEGRLLLKRDDTQTPRRL